jgi:hypothetical protein
MLKHGDFINKTRFPSSKSWPDIFENLSIPLLPYTPTSQDHNFNEARAQERILGRHDGGHMISKDP